MCVWVGRDWRFVFLVLFAFNQLLNTSLLLAAWSARHLLNFCIGFLGGYQNFITEQYTV